MSAAQDFWSRRRARVAEEEARIDARKRDAANQETQNQTDAQLADVPEEEVLASLSLPVPEDVNSGEMLQKFMANGVPTYLRRRAMRALWRSNPVFANLDGLVDYGDDFTDAANVVPDIKTAYQVGKGMLKHVEHLLADAKTDKSEDAPDLLEDGDADEIAPQPVASTSVPQPALSEPVLAEEINQKTDPVSETPMRPLRRMRFRTAGEEATA